MGMIDEYVITLTVGGSKWFWTGKAWWGADKAEIFSSLRETEEALPIARRTVATSHRHAVVYQKYVRDI